MTENEAAILYLLQVRGPQSRNAMATELKCSYRTIRNSIENLLRSESIHRLQRAAKQSVTHDRYGLKVHKEAEDRALTAVKTPPITWCSATTGKTYKPGPAQPIRAGADAALKLSSRIGSRMVPSKYLAASSNPTPHSDD